MTNCTVGQTYMWYLPEQAGKTTHLERCGTVLDTEGDWALVLTYTTDKHHAKGMKGEGNEYPPGPGGRNVLGYTCPHNMGWVNVTRMRRYLGVMNDYWMNRLWEDHDLYYQGTTDPEYMTYGPVKR